MTSHDAGSRQYDNVSDAIPDPDHVQGAHRTFDKGEPASLGGLVSDITSDLSTLVRQEIALAKAETRQSATEAGKGVGLLSGAAVAGYLAVLFLSLALWWALGSVLGSLGWSAVVVAVLWAVIAAVMAAVGRSNLKKVTGMPRTMETAKQVPDALKGNEDHA
jgi:hypothetical protein